MKVINNKTKKEYQISEEKWKKLQEKGLAARFTVVKDASKTFKPRELKVEKPVKVQSEDFKSQ
jgi:hypothetical protein